MTAADNTLIQIRKRVRRLTSSPNESSLATSDIDQYLNSFYTQDFIYAIKLDQLKTIKTIFTAPNIDRYSLDMNDYQGIRDPVYFEGVAGDLFKERSQFFNMWPRLPTENTPATGDGSTQVFNFTLNAIPFLSKEVVIGTVDTAGNSIKVTDDGNGNLVNAEDTTVNAGTVDYVTGVFVLDYTTMAVTPGSAEPITVWVSQYETSRPYCMLFWKDEVTIRPVPNNVYKVEFEAYLTPSQLLSTTDKPELNQWKDYLSLGTSLKILEDRGDMEGVEQVNVLFQRQEGLVLERQSVEEIGERNTTIYTSTQQAYSFGSSYGWY